MNLIKESMDIRYLEETEFQIVEDKSLCFDLENNPLLSNLPFLKNLNKIVQNRQTKDFFQITGLQVCRWRGIFLYQLVDLNSTFINASSGFGKLIVTIAIIDEKKHICSYSVNNFNDEFIVIDNTSLFIQDAIVLNKAWVAITASECFYTNYSDRQITDPYKIWVYLSNALSKIDALNYPELWKNGIKRLTERLVMEKDVLKIKMEYDGYDLSKLSIAE